MIYFARIGNMFYGTRITTSVCSLYDSAEPYNRFKPVYETRHCRKENVCVKKNPADTTSTSPPPHNCIKRHRYHFPKGFLLEHTCAHLYVSHFIPMPCRDTHRLTNPARFHFPTHVFAHTTPETMLACAVTQAPLNQS